MKKTLIYIFLLLLLISSIFYFLNKNNSLKENENTKPDLNNISTSTQNVDLDTKDWILSTNENFSFKYPKNFNTNYINIVDWPPKVTLEERPYSCNIDNTSEVLQGVRTEKEIINNKEYCVTKESEGAAGSIYTYYNFTSSYQNKTVVLKFSLRQPQCMNYDDPKQSECIKEEADFSPNSVIDNIVSTINM